MAKRAIFLYGIVCYLAFLGVFLYVPAFLLDLGVPKSINTGGTSPLGTSLAINLGLMSLFVVQHTIMARPRFKAWWTRIIPKAMERSTFVLATSGVLTLLYWQWRPLPEVVWSVDSIAGQAAIYLVHAAGIGIVLLTSVLINHFELFGLQQVTHNLLGKQPRPQAFVTPMLYKFVRHPMMTGMLLIFWAAPVMTQGHLLLAAGITGYIFFGTTMEERTLKAEFPSEYAEYKRTTPGILPLPRSRPTPEVTTSRATT